MTAYRTDWEQEGKNGGLSPECSYPCPPSPNGQLEWPPSPSAQYSQIPCPNPGLTAAPGTTALSIFQELWGNPWGQWTPPGLRPSQADPSSFLFGKGPEVLGISAIHLSNGKDGG